MSQIPTAEDLMALPPSFLAQDTSRVLFNVTTAFAVITTLVYVLFLTSRTFCAEHNSLEIWIIPVFSYAFCVGLWALGFSLVALGGAGRHAAYWFLTDPKVITTYLKMQTAAEFVYVASCLCPKLSILALYLRIFTDRKVRIGTWIAIGVAIAHAIANIIASFTICQPFEYKWNKTIHGHCANVIASYRYVSLPHILTDIAIFVLPLSSLYRLQISKRRRFGIFLTFVIGSLGIITAIIRFIMFFTLDLESDPTWYAPALFSYTIIEPWLRTTVNSYHSNNIDNTDQSTRIDIPLRNLKGSNTTSISTPKPISRRNDDDDRSHLILLEHSVDVEVSHGYFRRKV
ncbi:hypothetical protein GQX73_g7743 [Xylaria multiplex]|uniref:Rhodopsin domain-containing protein n=1 Tax=Xylaria multiplex TaxID=323545 RepID=A0A7C8IQQ1_9PEZI|nr:hypothetical protein GQX73_g7743 [Xylaria multiplex]